MKGDSHGALPPGCAIVFSVMVLAVACGVFLSGNTGQTASPPSMDDLNEILGKGGISSPLENDTWRNTTPSVSPSARSHHALGYDSKRGMVVLFGGQNEQLSYNDTWIYDPVNNVWMNVTPPVSPSPRVDFGFAYDEKSDNFILYGGRYGDGSIIMNDTWAYNPASRTWINMNPATHPPSCYGHAMAYDPKSDRIILFGGYCINYHSPETWAYDFNTNTWTNMHSSDPPAGRVNHRLVYDSRNHRLLLFSGVTPAGILNDLWSYDARSNTWTNLTPKITPPARLGHSMAYDIRSGRAVIFGGKNETIFFDDVWEYSRYTSTWQEDNASFKPSPRAWSAMTYDPITDCIILFGGYSDRYLNDTWTYRLHNIPYVTDVIPSDGVLDLTLRSGIIILFSEQMNESSTGDALTTNEKISLNWSGEGRALILKLNTTPVQEMSLTVRISKNATSREGYALEEEFIASFTVYPPFRKTFDRDAVILISLATCAGIAIACILSAEWIVYIVALLFTPLYLRIKKETALSNFIRGRVYQFIIDHPGAHLRFISKSLPISTGLLCYHLRMLEKTGLIRSTKKGYLKRFYATEIGKMSGKNRYAHIGKDVVALLKNMPGQSIKSLARILNMERSTVVYIINYLLDRRVILEKHTGRGTRYYVKADIDR